ncbi:GNAT family N-acetyltransferase [Nitrogeniibacter aestuarii]|uniref:GNAT family N-acetyltransferase n=1 Tax=Nitrogeniibacter aestuarii TaxID=2815343 RepID=UPI001E28B07C|nr:GNAT family N-acetyltransferase [Nitrogeniibacter aestuarii]
MDTNVELRPARVQDAASIAILAGQLGYPTSEAHMRARLANLLDQTERHAVVVASTADTLTGWIHVMRVDRLEIPPHGEIAALVVGEEYRGHEIGARLVEASVRWTHNAGLAHLTVRSRIERDDAHRFYQRMGFSMEKTQRVMTIGL